MFGQSSNEFASNLHLLSFPNNPDVGEKVRDSVQRAQINEICEEIEQAQKTLPALAAASLQPAPSPDAPPSAREEHSQAQLATRQNIDTLNDRTTALQTALNRAVISDAGSIIGNISNCDAKGTVLNRIHAAASAGESAPLTESLPAFASEATALEHIVTEAMEKISASDPQTTQELRIARDRIKGLSTAFIGAAKMLAGNPEDVLTKEHYAGVAKAWEEAVGEIRRVVIGQEGVFGAEELISGSSEYLPRLGGCASLQDTFSDGALLLFLGNRKWLRTPRP